MAAALRLFLRGRADAPSAPSLALLQPLFPRPYSKLAARPVPSPSLLRRTTGEGCSALMPRKPTDRGHGTQRPIQPSSPLLAISATSNIIGMQSMQIHPPPPQVPSLIRLYSSKGCAPQLPQQPIDPQTCQHLKQSDSVSTFYAPAVAVDTRKERTVAEATFPALVVSSALLRAVNSLAKQPALMLKGVATCEKAVDLLEAGVDDDKAFAMFEKGSDDALNALAVYENDLDVLARALRSAKGMELDIDVEPELMWCKRTKNSLKSLRQNMKELQRSRKTWRTMEKIGKWLDFGSVVLEAFVLLLLLLMSYRYI